MSSAVGPRTDPAPAGNVGGARPGGAVALPPEVTDALARGQRRRNLFDALLAAAIALVLSAIAFGADGGQQLAPKTYVEVCVIVGSSLIAVLALLAPPRPGRAPQPFHGAWTLAALAALTVLTAWSITWSLQPSDSWLESSRMLSYLCAFGAALGLVRLAPQRYAAVLYGIALASVIVCGYAVLTKLMPGTLAPDEQFARLREPFGYWNAVGVMAAIGVPPLLWLAARRTGHAVLNAFAYPALGLVLTTLMLSFSRGALLALLLGLAFWFSAVPLRLRGAAALLAGIGATIVTSAWAFSQEALTNDRVPLEARSAAGTDFAILLCLILPALLAVGLLANFLTVWAPPSARTRRIAGRGIVGGLALLPVAGLIALAAAPGGIDGQISKSWKSLTAKEAKTPPNTPARLTATASVRSRYWREALDVFGEHKLRGAGAGSFGIARMRYRTGKLNVRHAHGYVVQTLSDFGLLGLTLSLAALAAFLAAAGRATALRVGRRRRRTDRGMPFGPERVALLTMLTVVIVFGIHSTVDWTWFVPGTAIPALLCAGWLAGRGPLFGGTGAVRATVPGAAPRPLRPRIGTWELPEPMRLLAAAAVLAIAVASAWSTVQPLRSVHAGDAAIRRFDAGQIEAARSIAKIGAKRNPLSVEPLFELATIEDAVGNSTAAVKALQDAAALQPANPEVWRRLGRYLFIRQDLPDQALPALRAAYYLDPHSPTAVSDLLEVTRRRTGGGAGRCRGANRGRGLGVVRGCAGALVERSAGRFRSSPSYETHTDTCRRLRAAAGAVRTSRGSELGQRVRRLCGLGRPERQQPHRVGRRTRLQVRRQRPDRSRR